MNTKKNFFFAVASIAKCKRPKKLIRKGRKKSNSSRSFFLARSVEYVLVTTIDTSPSLSLWPASTLGLRGRRKSLSLSLSLRSHPLEGQCCTLTHVAKESSLLAARAVSRLSIQVECTRFGARPPSIEFSEERERAGPTPTDFAFDSDVCIASRVGPNCQRKRERERERYASLFVESFRVRRIARRRFF